MMRRLLLVGLGVAVGVILLAGPAHAQYAGGSPPPAGPAAPTQVLGQHFGASSSGGQGNGGGANFLASTGADIAELVGIALVAIGVGTVMARRRRPGRPA
jgi:hypothetical protein